jgi:hypothetical protein
VRKKVRMMELRKYSREVFHGAAASRCAKTNFDFESKLNEDSTPIDLHMDW